MIPTLIEKLIAIHNDPRVKIGWYEQSILQDTIKALKAIATPSRRLTDDRIEELFQEAAGADEDTHLRFARIVEREVIASSPQASPPQPEWAEYMQHPEWLANRAPPEAAAVPVALPHPGSPEASAMIDSLLAEYGWPSNTKNAARAGFEAARRWLAAPPHQAQGAEP